MAFIRVAASAVKNKLKTLSSNIDHRDVLKHIYVEVDVSAGYFALLSIANLIALSGLMMNSLPVIIGAMLISPLMGPILSFGYAFTTGDKVIFQRALKKISCSIAITLIVAAAATYVSPLKDITNEIAVRTRPNLYDLIVAFLSGIAGAVALCTKRSYITIVPGVAIATAVIPPLSVSGFGLGIGNLQIFSGGFFLFFTNFVAITISTSAVFYAYGFKPSIVTEEDVAAFRKRVYMLAAVLVIISIPLVYTLHSSIKSARLRVDVYNSLKKEFEKERKVRLSTFNMTEQPDDVLDLVVTANTERYLNDEEIGAIENGIEADLERDVKLYLDQILVFPRGLKELPVLLSKPGVSTVKSPADVLKTSREATINILRNLGTKLERMISPYAIADFSIGYSDKTSSVLAGLKIKRDEPFSGDEIKWLERMISEELSLPVSLSIETVAFVQPLSFEAGETGLTEDMRKSLMAVKDAYVKSADLNIKVVSYGGTGRKSAKEAKERLDNVLMVLTDEIGIPSGKIKKESLYKKKTDAPTVRVSVYFQKGRD